mmetsp:Transcript_28382/g.28680  ORF Transcript_28382/g.28680 Transcript_28382/m.28680 type:complete len:135 (+) Transcript_28382:282-686(+)
MRVSKKFAKNTGLATRFRISTDHDAIISNSKECLELPELEFNYIQKDCLAQSNRLKRKKYYEKYRNVERQREKIGRKEDDISSSYPASSNDSSKHDVNEFEVLSDSEGGNSDRESPSTWTWDEAIIWDNALSFF